MKIVKFVINKKKSSLTFEFSDKFRDELTFEFLRVYSPAENKKQAVTISHKKLVGISAIEPLAKHGFRIYFDDKHDAVYSSEMLRDLSSNKDTLWQDYLDKVKKTGASREGTIEIKQL